MKPYRAASWVAGDGQSDLVLTSPEEAGLSDKDLLAAAMAEIASSGIIREDGDRIVIGYWTP